MQYIQPQHHAKLAQAELLVIDEAAAIPLPVVKQLLGPYLVFLCSTVNGYEGTGGCGLDLDLGYRVLQQRDNNQPSWYNADCSPFDKAAVRSARPRGGIYDMSITRPPAAWAALFFARC